MKPLHSSGETISDRYQIVNTLGVGGVGTTYKALDLTTSETVAIKVVSLRQTQDWKVLELFEREAKVLASLDYDFIPNYLDYFELETSDDKRFYLIQELVNGKSLAELANSGWRATEAEVKDIAIQILNILVYLHSFSPPVIHRDIKPQNIIRREDGKVYLVDFGAVQDIYRNTVSLGKTFVGTLGYMPLEQLRGTVTPASDLYSLGGTLLFLLTHKFPVDLPQKGMKIDFSFRVNICDRFKAWLDKITEPIIEDRFQSATIALNALQNPPQKSASALTQPSDSRIIFTKNPTSLRFKIPLGSHYSFDSLYDNLGIISFFFVGFILLPEITIVAFIAWIWYNMSGSKTGKKTNQKIPAKHTSEKYVTLEINSQTVCLEKTRGVTYAGKANIKRQEINIADILWINTVGGKGSKDRVLITTENDLGKQGQYSFGMGYIDRQEARWIAQEVSTFIDTINQ